MNGPFSRRALIFVILRNINEVGLVEASFGLSIGRHWFRGERSNAHILTGLNLRAAEVASVSERLQVLIPHLLTGSACHFAELRAIITDVREDRKSTRLHSSH